MSFDETMAVSVAAVAAPEGSSLKKRKRDNNEVDEDDDDNSSKKSIFEELLLSCSDIQLMIAEYLDYDSFDEFGCVSTRCKQIHDHPSMAHRRTITVVATAGESVGQAPSPAQRLVSKLKDLHDKGIFRRFSRLKIQGQHPNINFKFLNFQEAYQNRDITALVDVMALDISALSKTGSYISALLLQHMPNLKEVDYSGSYETHHSFHLSQLRHLDTIISNRQTPSSFGLDGRIHYFGIHLNDPFDNLKELHLDDSKLFHNMGWSEIHRPSFIMLQEIKDNLVCLSIKNVTIRREGVNSELIPQQVIMNFVRNAPKLKWLRSDLTPQNVAILQKERPDVIFCS